MAKAAPAEYYLVLKDFQNKFFEGWPVRGYHIQTMFPKGREKVFNFPYQDVRLTDLHLTKHFYTYPNKPKTDSRGKEIPTTIYGAFGFKGNFNGKAKWVAIDMDDPEVTRITRERIIPIYKRLGISYIYEYSREDKGHLWFMTDCHISLLELFMEQVLEEAGTSRKEFDEIYPLFGKKNGQIRMPGGYHLKGNQRYPIEYKDKLIEDSLGIIKAFIDCPIVTEEFIRENTKAKLVDLAEKQKAKEEFIPEEKLTYTSRNLFVPRVGFSHPKYISRLMEECQAINSIVEEVAKDEMIEKRGGQHHMAGLFLRSLSKYVDKATKSMDGSEWFTSLVYTFRKRSDKSHQWDQAKAVIPRCEKWDENFDKCGGCPFKGKINSPKQLLWGNMLKGIKIKERSMRKLEDVRQNDLKPLLAHLNSLVRGFKND